MAITPSSEIDHDFFFYWFQQIDLNELSNGTTIPQINNYSFDEVSITYPTSLAEQKRIVEILDETFAAIDKAKANVERCLSLSKALFKSYLQNVFANKGEDWEEKRLSEVLQKTEMIDPTKTPNKDFIYIDVSSVNKENLEIESTSIIKGKDAPSRARKFIKTNDIIFATVRPTLKRIAIISNEYNEQVCSTGFFVMRTTELLNHKLIFYYLQTDSFFKQMEKLQRGASYPAVTESDVKNQIIHFPKSIQQQNKLADKLNNLSSETKKLETIYQQKLNDLKELKKSILQKAFNGELTAKEVV
ncbi:MAG: restriction endonuclease subunit S [Chitinophagaceae bacterium]|jgi:type I restriction enzyme S subunit|nr:restriction endonuclease subunit S [Chitinophagaceae bacterium]